MEKILFLQDFGKYLCLLDSVEVLSLKAILKKSRWMLHLISP